MFTNASDLDRRLSRRRGAMHDSTDPKAAGLPGALLAETAGKSAAHQGPANASESAGTPGPIDWDEFDRLYGGGADASRLVLLDSEGQQLHDATPRSLSATEARTSKPLHTRNVSGNAVRDPEALGLSASMGEGRRSSNPDMSQVIAGSNFDTRLKDQASTYPPRAAGALAQRRPSRSIEIPALESAFDAGFSVMNEETDMVHCPAAQPQGEAFVSRRNSNPALVPWDRLLGITVPPNVSLTQGRAGANLCVVLPQQAECGAGGPMSATRKSGGKGGNGAGHWAGEGSGGSTIESEASGSYPYEATMVVRRKTLVKKKAPKASPLLQKTNLSRDSRPLASRSGGFNHVQMDAAMGISPGGRGAASIAGGVVKTLKSAFQKVSRTAEASPGRLAVGGSFAAPKNSTSPGSNAPPSFRNSPGSLPRSHTTTVTNLATMSGSFGGQPRFSAHTMASSGAGGHGLLTPFVDVRQTLSSAAALRGASRGASPRTSAMYTGMGEDEMGMDCRFRSSGLSRLRSTESISGQSGSNAAKSPSRSRCSVQPFLSRVDSSEFPDSSSDSVTDGNGMGGAAEGNRVTLGPFASAAAARLSKGHGTGIGLEERGPSPAVPIPARKAQHRKRRNEVSFAGEAAARGLEGPARGLSGLSGLLSGLLGHKTADTNAASLCSSGPEGQPREPRASGQPAPKLEAPATHRLTPAGKNLIDPGALNLSFSPVESVTLSTAATSATSDTSMARASQSLPAPQLAPLAGGLPGPGKAARSTYSMFNRGAGNGHDTRSASGFPLWGRTRHWRVSRVQPESIGSTIDRQGSSPRTHGHGGGDAGLKPAGCFGRIFCFSR